ncbi:MAG: hypothetical protein MSS60_00255 [Clostridiales bacterium]|nr:hypothetical protein [Clostridiales bacterium]
MEAKNDNKSGLSVEVNVDCSDLDVAIEKANRLNALLREAASLIDSLFTGNQSKS